ncbi:DUF721 domain-containing protein [Phormidium tenue FACHB-886]|nr:DUF721 domain-containing protein [Phormidium tenue FACHB-886]
MALQSLHQVLGVLDRQDSWKGRRQFQQLLACWADVVGAAVAGQTRPIAIQRKVLQVATSSPAWAQNLTFERHRIVAKLNNRLKLDLIDIRFSSAHWHTSITAPDPADAMVLWRDHPSRLADNALPLRRAVPPDPQTAFRDWARTVRSRSQSLPLCPHCDCPTPSGELQRWGKCSLCAAKGFR